jgi:hypothetical protein
MHMKVYPCETCCGSDTVGYVEIALMCALGLVATIGTVAVLPGAFAWLCLTQRTRTALGLASEDETELMLVKKDVVKKDAKTSRLPTQPHHSRQGSSNNESLTNALVTTTHHGNSGANALMARSSSNGRVAEEGKWECPGE